MSRKLKRTISMCVIPLLIIALGAVYFLRPSEEEYRDDTPPRPAMTPLVQLYERDVVSVRFITEDEDFYMIPYVDEHGTIVWQWQPDTSLILQPARARDKARPAWQINSTGTAHEDTQGLNLADFGLQPPRLKMEAVYADGTTKNIYFGAQTADMRNHFAMISGSPSIYLIGNITADWAKADIGSLLDRTMQHFTIEAERILIAQRDKPPIELSMGQATELIDALSALTPVSPEGELLRLVQPMERAIDHTRLMYRVLEPLEFFRLGDTVSFLPTDLSPYGLDNPSLVFAYQDPVGETHLLFGDRFIEEVNGRDVEFIYVKLADRPHVFRTEFQSVSSLFDLNIFSFIERFIALPNILGVERVTITSPDESRNLDMVINHGENHSIAPTINGEEVDDSGFRVIYRLLIALMIEGEVEPFTPQGIPDLTIVYHQTEEPDIEIRLFALDSVLYAISLNGEDAWFVTHNRDVNAFFNQAAALMG
ncbi:MAG: DUF4340 domain-containing protein [Firmicutes bacterium]|nr:DUF4340 domain-containing protein [Bacillota bacterium]